QAVRPVHHADGEIALPTPLIGARNAGGPAEGGAGSCKQFPPRHTCSVARHGGTAMKAGLNGRRAFALLPCTGGSDMARSRRDRCTPARGGRFGGPGRIRTFMGCFRRALPYPLGNGSVGRVAGVEPAAWSLGETRSHPSELHAR